MAEEATNRSHYWFIFLSETIDVNDIIQKNPITKNSLFNKSSLYTGFELSELLSNPSCLLRSLLRFFVGQTLLLLQAGSLYSLLYSLVVLVDLLLMNLRNFTVILSYQIIRILIKVLEFFDEFLSII